MKIAKKISVLVSWLDNYDNFAKSTNVDIMFVHFNDIREDSIVILAKLILL